MARNPLRFSCVLFILDACFNPTYAFSFHDGQSLTSLYGSASAIASDDSKNWMKAESIINDKETFLSSLEEEFKLNPASKERTTLLNNMIQTKTVVGGGGGEAGAPANSRAAASIDRPGSWESFLPVAPGSWRVVYAPHMTTMANLAGGEFQVRYDLYKDGTMESHARYDFPFVGTGYLSVSGTFGSVDDNTCRVDFDEAWVKGVGENDSDEPYKTIDDVPDSLLKTVITRLGRLAFIDGVSVFPVSFLDQDLIVFDFELLGTRICSKKMF